MILVLPQPYQSSPQFDRLDILTSTASIFGTAAVYRSCEPRSFLPFRVSIPLKRTITSVLPVVSVHDATFGSYHYDPQACSPSDWRKTFTPGLSTAGSLAAVARYDYDADQVIASGGLSPLGTKNVMGCTKPCRRISLTRLSWNLATIVASCDTLQTFWGSYPCLIIPEGIVHAPSVLQVSQSSRSPFLHCALTQHHQYYGFIRHPANFLRFRSLIRRHFSHLRNTRMGLARASQVPFRSVRPCRR